MNENGQVLVARQATRRFGARVVVRHVDLDVRGGDVVTLVGPNGAGKTTLLKMLAGLTRPTSGSVIRKGSVDAVLHQSLLYHELTGRENLNFFARLAGPVDGQRIESLLTRVGLGEAADRRVRYYSRGMQQRLSIARALVNDPDVLLLDEPVSSLDEQGGQLVLELIAERRREGKAAVVVTHQIDRLFDVTTAVGYLHRGELRGPSPASEVDAATVTQQLRNLIAHV